MSENITHIEEVTTENAPEIPADAPPEIDPIEEQFTGDCPSISGRSTLTFGIGRHKDTGELHVRILENSGKGMFCKDWIKASDIEAVVKGATELTSKSFQVLQPGRSINTAGFTLAVLKDLGYIRPETDNTRVHEHVPATTFEKVAMARMGKTIEAAPAKPAKKKGKGA